MFYFGTTSTNYFHFFFFLILSDKITLQNINHRLIDKVNSSIESIEGAIT